MKRLNGKIAVCFITLCCFTAVAGSAQKKSRTTSLRPMLEGRSLLSLTPWSVKGARLICVVSVDQSNREQQLEIYREEKNELIPVFSREGDLIVSMYPLGTYDGRLLVIWSGGSTYYFDIYSFQEGTVKKVLDESSKIPPEFLYDDQGREIIFISQSMMKDGKWTLIDGTTEVFKWNGRSYDKIGTVPWAKRLRCLSKKSCASIKVSVRSRPKQAV